MSRPTADRDCAAQIRHPKLVSIKVNKILLETRISNYVPEPVEIEDRLESTMSFSNYFSSQTYEKSWWENVLFSLSLANMSFRSGLGDVCR